MPAVDKHGRFPEKYGRVKTRFLRVYLYKGWRVGWAGGGGMSSVEGLGLVLKK